MPRDHFFLDQKEDTIHANQIELKTSKEKRANWWYYHKLHVLISVVVVAVVISMVYSLVTKVEADYTISLLTSDNYSTDVIARLEEELLPYADDRNQDGQVVVRVVNYAVGADMEDIQAQEAGMVRLAGDSSTFESAIFLSDEEAFTWLEGQGGFFAYNDGSTPEEGATDYENMRIDWENCKALTEMDLSIEVLNKEEAQKYMSSLALSMRSLEGTGFAEDEEIVSYYEDSKAMYERLISGEKLENSQNTSESE